MTKRNKGPRHFTAIGSGQFPLDMLRYDSCHPYQGEDVSKIEASLDRDRCDGAKRMIVLVTNSESTTVPTVGRWESFGWRIITGIERQSTAL